jgi:hypothetical protein
VVKNFDKCRRNEWILLIFNRNIRARALEEDPPETVVAYTHGQLSKKVIHSVYLGTLRACSGFGSEAKESKY